MPASEAKDRQSVKHAEKSGQKIFVTPREYCPIRYIGGCGAKLADDL